LTPLPSLEHAAVKLHGGAARPGRGV